MDYLDENKFVELIGKIPNVAVQGYNEKRAVIYWNKASEIIYGYTKEEALGKQLEDLIIPDFMKNDVISAHTKWCNHNIAIPSGELPLKHKNGDTVYVYSSHVMLKENSDTPEMFCVDIDLTEQKRQKDELDQKNEILAHQSKMAAMGEMLDNIAHQWRQPLSLISSSASGIKLKSEYEILDTLSLNDSLSSIVDTTKYLSQTIDDFRNFINGSHQKIVFNLFDTLNKSFKLLDGVIKKNDIEVVISTTSEEIEILGYPNELIQVVINLVSNAKDALKGNGNKRKLILIDIKEDEENIFIKIKDNANGIKENLIDKIFDCHFSTKDKSENSGLGLYMSHQLITKSMNGLLRVENSKFDYENEKYLGAEFTIELDINGKKSSIKKG
jgi:PAS domain S-box-containing protein